MSTSSSAAELDLDAGWGVGEEAFDQLVRLARERGVRNVLEFGSGASTIRLAQALPEAHIVSVEHDPAYGSQTARQLVEHGVADRVVLCPAPLAYWWFRGRLFYTYDVDLPAEAYDLVLIDGPPGYLITGRQGCLHRCYPLLAPDALIVLDDYGEPRERRTAARWRAAYPDVFGERVLSAGHTMLLLDKRRERPPAWPGPAELIFNALDNVRSLASRLRHRLGSLGPRSAHGP